MNFRNGLTFVLDRPDKPNLILVGKAKSLPKSGAHEKFFTWIGTSLLANLRLEWEGFFLVFLVTYTVTLCITISLSSLHFNIANNTILR
jgi:hypothetical protein